MKKNRKRKKNWDNGNLNFEGYYLDDFKFNGIGLDKNGENVYN